LDISFFSKVLLFKLFSISAFMLFNPIAVTAQTESKIVSKGKLPVSHKIFNNDTNNLQFVIVSDLWGGRRPGIFEDAVTKVALLQPQFVISVGDLIDGKSNEPKEINRQWDEFDQAIKPLTMPFFYVPGNHDIGNPAMEVEWRKRLGSPYYHFVYKNVLFLCINTEDGGKGGIREEQIKYFQKVISENKNVRWTFLFMHRPVWQGNDHKQEGYEKIEAFLTGRNYTLFSGHHHTYLATKKNGNKHFVLGSTGGGSDLRGEKYGEFDHITVVSLSAGEPTIVNLKLDGIIKENVVDEITHSITQTLINQTWLNPVPKVSDKQHEASVAAEIILSNPTNFPMKVIGLLNHNREFDFIPTNIDMIIPPQTSQKQILKISRSDQSLLNFASTPFIEVSLQADFIHNNIPYSMPASKKLLLSWKMITHHKKKSANQARNEYNGVDTSEMISVSNPEYLKGPWYWSGVNDCFLRFKTTRDDAYVYTTILVNDDQWIYETEKTSDMIHLNFEDMNGVENSINVPLSNFIPAVTGNGMINKSDVRLNKHFVDGLLMVECKIPINKLKKKDGTFRMNIGYFDSDATPEKQSSTLFWKPIWGSEGDYKISGTFFIN
jgi:predicted phosphodiesterase